MLPRRWEACDSGDGRRARGEVFRRGVQSEQRPEFGPIDAAPAYAVGVHALRVFEQQIFSQRGGRVQRPPQLRVTSFPPDSVAGMSKSEVRGRCCVDVEAPQVARILSSVASWE